jgi:hypothetical protein
LRSEERSVDSTAVRTEKWDAFYEPTRALALRLLDINWRDEAGRLEPIHLGQNAGAFKRIPTIQWADYPYTVALVLGYGLDEQMEKDNHALNPMGKLAIEIAARRYRDKRVPLIIVSAATCTRSTRGFPKPWR